MRVEVKRSHIKRGRQGSRGECPIALALEDLFKTQIVAVDASVLEINGATFKTPRKASSFIYAFDKSKSKAKPFSFNL